MTEPIVEKKENKKSDIFVTEEDIFDISIKYYTRDSRLFVKKVDEDFDDKVTPLKTIDITLKCPSQGDSMIIERSITNGEPASDSLKTFLRMEYSRFMVLARKWSLPEKLEESQVLKLNPKIVKAIFQEIREKISLEGLL